MKRLTSLLLGLTLLLGLAACNSVGTSESAAPSAQGTEQTATPAPTPDPAPTPETLQSPTSAGRVLVVYFSIPETTDPDNMTQEEDNSVVVIDGEVLGNTQYMAYVIRDTLGADIFRIEPETPYPTDHETLVDLARDEQGRNFRPAIKDTVDNMDSYDVIYLGYPNWWGDMPMILYSFLEQYDLSGKTIVPFNTHGGSGFSNTISTIAELQPNATVVQDGLTISRNHIQDAEQEIINWVQGLN